ncbi:hypothetical protein K438DRAFT_1758587 [Mycena galopus ATCC 62051]|nr:hypothetical protein K438DRAFT_1758587 [Mycena galopus ATCC 62051]
MACGSIRLLMPRIAPLYPPRASVASERRTRSAATVLEAYASAGAWVKVAASSVTASWSLLWGKGPRVPVRAAYVEKMAGARSVVAGGRGSRGTRWDDDVCITGAASSGEARPRAPAARLRKAMYYETWDASSGDAQLKPPERSRKGLLLYGAPWRCDATLRKPVTRCSYCGTGADAAGVQGRVAECSCVTGWGYRCGGPWAGGDSYLWAGWRRSQLHYGIREKAKMTGSAKRTYLEGKKRWADLVGYPGAGRAARRDRKVMEADMEAIGLPDSGIGHE